MNLLINGEAAQLKEGSNILDALKDLGQKTSFFAVALNKNFVPKSQYEKTILKDNDQIEVVTPHPGG